MSFTDHKGQHHEFRRAIPLSLHNLREVDANGDVGNIVANGGLLASDTTPILRGVSGGISQEVSWATGNVDNVAAQVALPPDFSGKDAVDVDLWVYSGTTDAASFTVQSSWDAGAAVSDTATDANKSATVHKITATIAPADIPDNASFLTLLLTPAAHATNTIQLVAARVTYVPKIISN